MAYLTDEIDEGATRRKMDEIISAGLHELDERAERAAQIDEEFRQAQAKMEEEARAMDKLVADSHEKDSDDKDDEDATSQAQWQREAKPTVLSFYGEDDTPAQQAPAALPSPQAALPVPVPPPMPDPPPSRGNLLSLGYEDDEPQSQPQQSPQPQPPAPAQSQGRHAARPKPPEDDDDLSDVNWMR